MSNMDENYDIDVHIRSGRQQSIPDTNEIHDLTASLAAIDFGDKFIKRRGVSYDPSNPKKDTFPVLKKQIRWFYVCWDGMPSEWRIIYSSEEISDVQDYATIQSSDRSIYFNDITQIYRESLPSIGFRIYRDSEVIKLVPTDTKNGLKICDMWVKAIEAALQIVYYGDNDITSRLRDNWLKVHPNSLKSSANDDNTKTIIEDRQMSSSDIPSSIASTTYSEGNEDNLNDESKPYDDENEFDNKTELNQTNNNSKSSFNLFRTMRSLLSIRKPKQSNETDQNIHNTNHEYVDDIHDTSLHTDEDNHVTSLSYQHAEDVTNDVGELTESILTHDNYMQSSKIIKGILKHTYDESTVSSALVSKPVNPMSRIEQLKEETSHYNYNDSNSDSLISYQSIPKVIDTLIESQRNQLSLQSQLQDRRKQSIQNEEYLPDLPSKISTKAPLELVNPDMKVNVRSSSLKPSANENTAINHKNSFESMMAQKLTPQILSTSTTDTKSTILTKLIPSVPSSVQSSSSKGNSISSTVLSHGIDVLCSLETNKKILRLTQLKVASAVTTIQLDDILSLEYMEEDGNHGYFKIFVALQTSNKSIYASMDQVMKSRHIEGGWLNFYSKNMKETIIWLQKLADQKKCS